MNELVELIVLLLPALVLWSIPKTRRATGGGVTAWKTVPFGCATMLVVTNLLLFMVMGLGEALHMPEFKPISAILLVGAVGFGVLAGKRVVSAMKRFIRKRYGQPEGGGPESKKPYYFAFCCLALMAVLFVLVSFIWEMRGGYHGTWRTYPVVTGHGTELAFQERPIHPFLAEYDYRFRFRGDGRETLQDLWLNTGGRTYFNVFRLKNGDLLFSDKVNDYIVDVKTRKVLTVENVGGRRYAGALPAGKIFSYGVETSGENSGKVFICINEHRIEAFEVTDRLAEPAYIGCITHGFHSAAEKPYKPVKKLFPRIPPPAKPQE